MFLLRKLIDLTAQSFCKPEVVNYRLIFENSCILALKPTDHILRSKIISYSQLATQSESQYLQSSPRVELVHPQTVVHIQQLVLPLEVGLKVL